MLVRPAALVAAADSGEEIAESASTLWESTVDALPRIGVATAVIAAGWVVSRLIRHVARRGFERRASRSFAQVMSKVLGWFFLTLIVLAALAITFPSIRPVDLLAGVGFFSVAVGFAFQDILENTLAGMLLIFRQPFRSGDQVEVHDQLGTVEVINIRETRITTFDGELVIIPNREVYKSVIRVQTANALVRSDFVVGISYDADPAEAARVIESALGEVDAVATQPPPTALVEKLDLSTVNLRVRIWTDSVQWDRLLAVDEAIRASKAALDRAGVEMPAPILAVRATPSLRSAVHDDGEITPGGSLRS